MNKDIKINSPVNTIPLLRDMPDTVYGSQIVGVLDYLHTGTFDFTLCEDLLAVANECSQTLEHDYCTDEALNDAIQFTHNCRASATNSEQYELASLLKGELEHFDLDAFSYYLLSIKKLPTSHNLHAFRRHQYLALYILSRIIELGRHDATAPEKPGHAPAEQSRVIMKLYQVYRLLRDKETNTPSSTQNSALLAESLSKDSLSRGESSFGTRMHTAIDNIYTKNRIKFSALNAVQVAIFICENDNFLDYYFHNSTPKEISLAAQKELNDKGYLTSVLESVEKLRA